MKILVLNSGSSSLKYKVIDIISEYVLAEGLCERIGLDGRIIYKVESKNIKENIEVELPTHKEAIELVLEKIQNIDNGVIKSIEEINAIGHRVAHGGEYFDDSVVVNDDVLQKIRELSELAPLHNPANVLGIEICKELMPDKTNVAVFDTAFHQSMPDYSYMYALPIEDYEELKVRKYGFHGTSHKYVSNIANEYLNKENSKIIVCHLGNGSSITSVKNGQSIDTSMGFTPLQGLMMGTRCGDIDPASVLYIMDKRNLTSNEMNTRMNKESGILGVFGDSSDCRDLQEEMNKGNKRARLAFDMLIFKIKKYIGAYAASLGGVDAICFTGGIGENSSVVRERVCKDLEFMGVKLNIQKNSERQDGIVELSSEESKVKVFKIPTNEELVIARDTYRLV
ncbi:acetate/propionate family kinase [Oceanirhabdus sp. W0125-5]|uniref:acetate/propionate family kinase n=1 Tax=Oceanirhabdus sp. W0125-5 TaxID=2999116 RepID=UPI0022F2E4F2|nr:acetate kinase [Oceanirhabdus sp. W0125-5]WBW97469.1 acetate kinase [Oceanirhabdus sp. W0125-5]